MGQDLSTPCTKERSGVNAPPRYTKHIRRKLAKDSLKNQSSPVATHTESAMRPPSCSTPAYVTKVTQPRDSPPTHEKTNRDSEDLGAKNVPEVEKASTGFEELPIIKPHYAPQCRAVYPTWIGLYQDASVQPGQRLEPMPRHVSHTLSSLSSSLQKSSIRQRPLRSRPLPSPGLAVAAAAATVRSSRDASSANSGPDCHDLPDVGSTLYPEQHVVSADIQSPTQNALDKARWPDLTSPAPDDRPRSLGGGSQQAYTSGYMSECDSTKGIRATDTVSYTQSESFNRYATDHAMAIELNRQEVESKQLQELTDAILALELQEQENRDQAAHNIQPELVECTVCMEPLQSLAFSSKSPSSGCKHKPQTCTRCLEQWIASQLDSTGWQRVSCPQCTLELSHADVRRAADNDTFNQYDRFFTLRALESDQDFSRCRNPGCDSGQVNLTSTAHMRCVSCGFQQCVRHDGPWHRGETCDQYDRRVRREERRHSSRLELEKRASEIYLRDTKLCPNAGCRARIKKDGGCDQMTCSRCQRHFNWRTI